MFLKKNTCAKLRREFNHQRRGAFKSEAIGWDPVKCLIEALGVLGWTNFANEVKYAFLDLDELMREKRLCSPRARPTLVLQTPSVCACLMCRSAPRWWSERGGMNFLAAAKRANARFKTLLRIISCVSRAARVCEPNFFTLGCVLRIRKWCYAHERVNQQIDTFASLLGAVRACKYSTSSIFRL